MINAPYIYGARPGNPFLFTVPVSGERPLNITATNLPEGLSSIVIPALLQEKR